jgi:hypothetical protein
MGEGGTRAGNTPPAERSSGSGARTGNFVAAHHALEHEFTVASVIKARGDADKTQEGVAKAMGTTQAVVARLESGRPWLRPAH